MNMKNHAARMIEHHTKMAEVAGGLAEQCDNEGYADQAKLHRVAEKDHGSMVKHFESMHADASNKAAIDELNKNRAELEPTRVSAIAPPDPNLRMIPRYGQPPVRKADIDVEFAHLFKTADGTEGPQ